MHKAFAKERTSLHPGLRHAKGVTLICLWFQELVKKRKYNPVKHILHLILTALIEE